MLVNNAGILTDKPLLGMEDADILAHLAINAIGPLQLIRALAPAMAERGYDRIGNMSPGWGAFDESMGPGAHVNGRARRQSLC